MLKHCGFGEEVELQAKGARWFCGWSRRRERGWAGAFSRMNAAGDDNLVHEDAPTATS